VRAFAFRVTPTVVFRARVHVQALGFVRADGVAGLAARAHGRAILGAGGAGFRRTVRATACVGGGRTVAELVVITRLR